MKTSLNPKQLPSPNPLTGGKARAFKGARLPPEGLAYASQILRILNNPSRLTVLGVLAGGEKSVGELNSLLGGSRSSVARHMSLLRRQGLISPRRCGTRVYYSLNARRGGEVRSMLATLNRIGYDFPCGRESKKSAAPPAAPTRIPATGR